MNLDPPNPDDLHAVLQQFRRDQTALRARDDSLEVLIGESPAMGRLRAQVDAAASSGAYALISGPSAGELVEVARTIHYRAHPTGKAPLVRIEAALVRPEELRRLLSPAAVGSAVGGTLLFEEVHQLPAALQAELVSGLRAEDWRGQVLATLVTDADAPTDSLSDELHAALATLTIAVPPLAERPEDLPLLAQWRLEQLGENSGKQLRGFMDDALDRLVLYDWPGELGELRDAVAAAHAKCTGPLIAAGDLPAFVRHAVGQASLLNEPPEPIQLDEYLRKVESLLVERALELAGGNKAEAARLLGVSRPRLYRMLEQQDTAITEKPAEPKPRSKPKSAEPLEPIVPRDEIEFLPVDGDGNRE